MTETVTLPAEQALAGESGVQRPTGPHYLWDGSRTVVVYVDHWVDDDPRCYHFGGMRLWGLFDGQRLLGPVPIPPAGSLGPLGDRVGPTQVLSDLVRDAYRSGVTAGSTGLPAHLQEVPQGHLIDRAAASLGAMFATGGPPLDRSVIDLLTVVNKIIDECVAVGVKRGDGQGGVADWGLTEELCGLASRALSQIEPLLTRPNPHHPVERLRTYGHEDFVSWVGENAALRRHLLWVAGRAEVTSETRRLLAARIREGSDAVVADRAEDDHRQVLDFRRLVEEVCALIDAAVEARIPELTHSDRDKRPGKLPMYWNGRAEDRARALRSALEDLPEIETLAGIRFA